jgi:outer membrane protein TolC
MNRLILTFLLLAAINLVSGKEITLEDCRNKAIATSPLVKQLMLQQSRYLFDEKALSGNYLPQLSIEGQATYQSEVLKFNLPIPNLNLPEISKDQYKIWVNVTQQIWDGGITSASKDMKLIESNLNQAITNVNLYSINDIINQLYFNILLTKENIGTLIVAKKQLDTNKHIIESLVRNGVMLRSSYESVLIELLKIEQNIEQLKSSLKSMLGMMSEWTEIEISETDVFLIPGTKPDESLRINRAEFLVFDEKDKLSDAGSSMTETQLMPKVFAFGQSGWGNPNPFNFFDTEGSFFYLIGVKFQWSPFDWNSNHNKRQSIITGKQINATERENFIKTLNIGIGREKSELERFEKLLMLDAEIINRQQLICQEYFSRVKNSSITINEYLAQTNALLVAQINRDIHKIQQIRSIVNLLTLTGNL